MERTERFIGEILERSPERHLDGFDIGPVGCASIGHRSLQDGGKIDRVIGLGRLHHAGIASAVEGKFQSADAGGNQHRHEHGLVRGKCRAIAFTALFLLRKIAFHKFGKIDGVSLAGHRGNSSWLSDNAQPAPFPLSSSRTRECLILPSGTRAFDIAFDAKRRDRRIGRVKIGEDRLN